MPADPIGAGIVGIFSVDEPTVRWSNLNANVIQTVEARVDPQKPCCFREIAADPLCRIARSSRRRTGDRDQTFPSRPGPIRRAKPCPTLKSDFSRKSPVRRHNENRVQAESLNPVAVKLHESRWHTSSAVRTAVQN